MNEMVNLEDANTTSSWHAYTAAYDYSRKWRYQKCTWLLRKAIYNTFKNYNPNVYVGQAPIGIDRYYGYPFEIVTISRRISETEVLHTNCVHPSDIGYHMLADGYYQQLKGVLLE